MAVLKDLIVHGPSRFLGSTYFNLIEAKRIEADEGSFTKLIAKNVTATNATVVGLLDVTGELHTKSFSNSNIATIDGSFYITPTMGLQGGDTTTNTATVTANSLAFVNSGGTNFNFDSLYLDTTTPGTSTSISWSTGSAVIVTGEIQSASGEWMPLGTLKGTLQTYTTTSVVINNIKDGQNNSAPATLTALVGSKLRYRNIKISLVSINRSSKLMPLGIFMTATGANGRTFLDIYGGNNAESNVYSGLSTPVVRIGNLYGLPKVGDVTPGGWGIYTNNGFFTGTIVAKQGKIGDGGAAWTIGNADSGEAYIYTGTQGENGSAYMSTGYGTVSIADSGVLTDQKWVYTAGKNFGVTTDGTLYAKGAQITGTIVATAGTIGGASISNGVLKIKDANIDGTISANHIDASSITIGQSQVTNLTTDLGKKASTDALTAEINQRKATYGTQSATSSDAATQAKAITCANFELVAGNEITIYFKYANTYASGAVQLNVNGKGAKNVWVANAVTSASNKLLWGAGAYITFRYNGSVFIVEGEPRTWYGASTTAAGTAAKTDTTAVTGCVICKGTKVALAMTNENTATAPTLNIQSTGALAIYAGNSTTRPLASNGLSWSSGYTQEFVFDGTQWRTSDSGASARSKAQSDAAEKTATSYITEIDDDGISIHAENNPDSNYSVINADGLEVYKDGDSVALFGATSRVGAEYDHHINILPTKMSLITKQGAEVFSINNNVDSVPMLVTASSVTGSGDGSVPVIIDDSVPTGAKLSGTISASFTIDKAKVIKSQTIKNNTGFDDTKTLYSVTDFTYKNFGMHFVNYAINADFSIVRGTSKNGSLTYQVDYYFYNDSNTIYTINLSINYTYDGDKTLNVTIAVDRTDRGSTSGLTIYPLTYTATVRGASYSLGTTSGEIYPFTVALGQSIRHSGSHHVGMGQFNEVANSAAPIFTIGNGDSDTSRSNAVQVTSDGDIHMYIDDDAGEGIDYDIGHTLWLLGWDCTGSISYDTTLTD